LFFSFKNVAMDAALRERAGLDGEETDLEGGALRVHGGHLQGGEAGPGGQHALQDGSAFDCHG
jgi:hypothetical protein